MKIVVIGGTGLIGSKLVTKLRAQGHEAVAASPNSGVNTLTGEGLTGVLADASVVVDVSNSPSFEPAAVLKFFETSTRNLLTYEAEAGVGHHVALSIVGSERLPENGYFRAKVAQEKLIKESSIPYSIVHSTQFFEFVKGIADDATSGSVVHIAPVAFQPIAGDDVASALARVAVGTPLNGTIEIAGPERTRFDEFIRRGLSARHDPREVIADTHARYFGGELSETSLVPGDHAQLGETRFEDWLRSATSQIPTPSPQPAVVAAPIDRAALKDNEFRIGDVPPGSALRVGSVAVFNIGGSFFATQEKCTHRQGPLSEGKLDGSTVTCPIHGAQFNVSTGAVLRGPAKDPLRIYRVIVDGEIGRIEAGQLQQSA
jgi:uncharacterized protein YbjT (DUF2867 family)/nitrite reductase/ring-hydroxylating ferredoxin subunit